MRKGIVGNWVMSKNWILLAFVFAVVFSGIPALGQDIAADSANWRFQPLAIEFYKQGSVKTLPGTSIHPATFANAILSASDVNNQIFGNKRDGAIADATAGTLVNTFFNASGDTAVHAGRQILANVEQGETLNLTTIVNGLDEDIVTQIREGNTATAEAVRDLIAAEFSSELFGFDAGNAFAAVTPSSVTGIPGLIPGAEPRDFGFWQGDNTSQSADVAVFATMVVVRWDGSQTSPALVVSATDRSLAARAGFSATATINNDTANQGSSNLLGIEIGDDDGNHSGPEVSYSGGLPEFEVLRVIDTISRRLFDTTVTLPSLTPPFDNTQIFPANPNGGAVLLDPPSGIVNGSPVQYRTKDIVVVEAEIIHNAHLDGEPDAYFGEFSDPIHFSVDPAAQDVVLNAAGNITFSSGVADFSPGSLSVQTDANSPVSNNTLMSVSIRTPGGEAVTPVSILTATFPVRDELATSGPFDLFRFDATVSDDVNLATTTTSAPLTHPDALAVDTAGPMISNIELDAEGAPDIAPDEIGFISSRRISTAPGFNEALVDVRILTGGESGAEDDIENWLNFTVIPDPTSWHSGVLPIDYKTSGDVGINIVQNIGQGTSLGVTSTINVVNNVDITLDSVSVIASVSDDARNPALGYVPATTAAVNDLGFLTFNGEDHIPVAAVNTDATFITSLNNLSETTFRIIDSSTLAVDNESPAVLTAVLTVTAMPDVYWREISSTSTEGRGRFNLLRQSDEQLLSPLNVGKWSNASELATIIAASPTIIDVTRGTAGITSTNTNGQGSPVRLVVSFRPAGLNTDTDIRGFDTRDSMASLSADQMRSFVANNFIFAITAERLGWVPDNDNPFLPSGWSLTDATMHSDNIAFATLENTSGIPNSLLSDLTTVDSTDDVPVTVTVNDRVRNLSPNAFSNPLVVDINTPVVGLAPSTIDGVTFVGGSQIARSILLITDTQNRNKTVIENQLGPLDDIDLRQLVNNLSDFTNAGVNISAGGVPEVEAGDTIIVSATFVEPPHPNDPANLFTLLDEKGAYPHILGLEGLGSFGTEAIDQEVVNAFGTPPTKYGERFKTISANFSDFVTTAGDVLPDVTRLVSGPSDGIGAAVEGDIIAATWFFTIESAAPINGAIANDAVRSVTLIARDLSGNLHFEGIPAARGDFQIPEVTITNLLIHIPNRSIPAARIQPSNIVDSISNAFTISAATQNLDNANFTLVAQVSNGPFTSNPDGFVTANFAAVGGGVLEPDSITFSDGVTQPENATASIVTATWITGTFDGLEGSVVATNSAQIVVTATGTSLAAGQAQSNGIQVDQNRPDITGGDVLEEDINGTPTFGSSDSGGDGILRPNQRFIASVIWTLDAVDLQKVSQGNIINDLLEIKGNFNEFGISNLLDPSRVDINGNILTATFEATVASNVPNQIAQFVVEATDSAGNATTFQGDQVFINASRPQVTSNILSASHFVGHPTDSAHPVNQFYEVGRNINGNLSFAQNGTKTIVRSGDRMRIRAEFAINDSAFSSLNLFADWSDVLGEDFEITRTDDFAISGGIVNATWTQFVNSAVANNTQAVIILNASNDANLDAVEFATRTVSFVVDNIAPAVSIDTIFENADGDELTDSALRTSDPITADAVVHATFPDADIFHGFAGSPIAAGVDLLQNSASTPQQKLDQSIRALISLQANQVTSGGGIVDVNTGHLVAWQLGSKANGISEVSQDYRNGETSHSSSEDRITAIRESTATTFIAWYENITVNQPSRAAASLVATVSDSIGNKGTDSSPARVLDSTPPAILPHPFEIAWVTGPVYPARYDSDGNIISATRVSQGSVIRANFNISDQPITSNSIDASYQASKYDARNTGTVVSDGTVTNISHNTNQDQLFFTVTPDGSSANVTVDITVGEDAQTSFPISPALNQPTILSNSFGYPLSNPLSTASETLAHATDNLGNSTTAVSTRLEIDNEGPQFIRDATGGAQFVITVADSVDFARNLQPNSTILSPTFNLDVVNAVVGQWLIFAATVVVDGTEDVHFQNFNVEWIEALEQDVDRLVDETQEQGSVLIAEGATRSVRFVTSTIQIQSNASPSAPEIVTVHMEDFFNNVSEIETDNVAISAQGPSAIQVALFIDGESQFEVGTSNLGIGNLGPDATGSAFEIGPGSVVEVEAIINTIAGRAPQFITADFSNFYHPSLQESVNEIVPSVTEITPQGTVRAHWRHIVADYTNIDVTATQAFADIDIAFATSGTLFKNALVQNVTTDGVTSIGSGGTATPNANFGNILPNLMGLPFIQLQPNAAARRVAWVTVFVNEEPPENLFGPTNSPSSRFAVDTQTPIASWEVPTTLIDRALPAEHLATSGARVGFPTAPNLRNVPITEIPARLRGGDTAYFIVDITNPTIDRTGDDNFRQLPGTEFDPATVFSLDSAGMSILQVSNDLSDFGGPSVANVIAPDLVEGSDPPFHVLSFVPGVGGPTVIRATYAVTISSDVGTTAVSSRQLREVTPTVVDDAGNRPHDTFFNTDIKRLISPGGIGVDNIGPSISGTLEVVVNSGSAIGPNGVNLGPGSVVPGNSIIVADSVLAITATVNDQVDNPLDILNNVNFGPIALSALGIQLPADAVLLRVTDARLSGNSILVPFEVQIPSAEEGVSTENLRFVISATDTIGNATSRASNDRFLFDARPAVEIVQTGGTVNEQDEVVVHAGDPTPTVLDAQAFDVGGVRRITWDVLPSPDALALNGVTVTSDFEIIDESTPQNLSLPLTITASPEDIDTIGFAATATAEDVDGNVNSSEQVGVIINQPALLAETFPGEETTAGGAVEELNGALTGDAGLSAVGGDIREVTIPEGSSISIVLSATDANSADTAVISVTGSAFTSSAIQDATFGDSADSEGNLVATGSGTFTFTPGFLAVSGGVDKATFEANFAAWDGRHTLKDWATVLVNVTAQSATPDIQVVSILVGDATQPATLGDTLELPEGQDLTIVLSGTDAGGEELAFSATSDTSIPFEATTSVSDGVTFATVTLSTDFSSADIPLIFESAIDPSLLTFSFSNSEVTASDTKLIDIINVSQPANITALYRIGSGGQFNIEDGGRINTVPGQTITFNIRSVDPDQDRLSIPDIELNAPAGFGLTDTITDIGENATSVENEVVVTIPADAVVPVTATLSYDITDDTGRVANANYFIVVTSPSELPNIDEIIIAQGEGGINLINIRNFDDNASAPKNAVIDSYRNLSGRFLANVGGGTGRSTLVTAGDVDGDSVDEIVDSYGPITASATYPNVINVREKDTKLPVGFDSGGASFQPFPAGDANTVQYNEGELRTAIGDFKVDGTNLVAVAQGQDSGDGLVRLLQFDPRPRAQLLTDGLSPVGAFGWHVVGQFQPLDNAPTANNANGGVTISAADVDGDGVDEIIAGQTSSETSLTQFTVLDVDASGNLPVRRNFTAFTDGFRGDGGVEIVGTDLNGDGSVELVAVSKGKRDAEDLGSLVTVIRPVVSDDTITGFERPGGLTIFQAVSESSGNNPGGGLSLAAGELNGNPFDGEELVIGSGEGAPQSFYRVLKLDYDGTDVNGFSFLIGPPQNLSFIMRAYVGEFNPTSGAVNVEVIDFTSPGSPSAE